MNMTKRFYITFACCYIIAMGLFARNMSAKSFLGMPYIAKEMSAFLKMQTLIIKINKRKRNFISVMVQ